MLQKFSKRKWAKTPPYIGKKTSLTPLQPPLKTLHQISEDSNMFPDKTTVYRLNYGIYISKLHLL